METFFAKMIGVILGAFIGFNIIYAFYYGIPMILNFVGEVWRRIRTSVK